jgi:hypothetical protein
MFDRGSKLEEFRKYNTDFKVTCGGIMETFLDMKLKQDEKSAKLYMDLYVRQMLVQYRSTSRDCVQSKV